MRLPGLLKIEFFIMQVVTGFWRSLLNGCSGLVDSCLRFDEWIVA